MGGPCVLLLVALVALLVWLVGLLWQTFASAGATPETARLRRSQLVVRWLLWFVLGGVLVALLFPVTPKARKATRRAVCCNNLRQIWMAWEQFYDANGRFPPAYTTDDEGWPLHSWRVLLLPYLEYDDLYQRVKLDEPWNSPHNLALFESAETPEVYRCRSAEGDPRETSYVMIVGPGTISDGPNARRREHVADGLGKTIVVAEATDSGIRWYEPADLEFDDMAFTINAPKGKGIRSGHGGLAHALFADGSVHAIFDDVDSGILKALITIAGGEDVTKCQRFH
jgi:prepilin-type processing-associated H-X9-DG protein